MSDWLAVFQREAEESRVREKAEAIALIEHHISILANLDEMSSSDLLDIYTETVARCYSNIGKQMAKASFTEQLREELDHRLEAFGK